MTRLARTLPVLAAAGALFVSVSASAAPCGKPDLLYALPPDKADSVPTDATPSAIYTLTAEYLDEDVPFQKSDGTDVPAQVDFDSADGILTLTPDAPLEAGATYTVKWPALRGIATASKGRGREVTFTAGSGPDAGPPSFDGVTGVDWDVHRERDSCTDSVEERFIFDLDLAPADDDSGRDALALIVFQTSGPGITAPEPVDVRAMPSADTVRITRTVGETTGHICFAALARDLAGKASASADRTACVDTIRPPFFYGCRVAAGRRRGGAGWLALALGGFVLGWRRRAG